MVCAVCMTLQSRIGAVSIRVAAGRLLFARPLASPWTKTHCRAIHSKMLATLFSTFGGQLDGRTGCLKLVITTRMPIISRSDTAGFKAHEEKTLVTWNALILGIILKKVLVVFRLTDALQAGDLGVFAFHDVPSRRFATRFLC